jgi:hypothetical protein
MPFPPLICRWPNGDISLVAANSRTEADYLLDEIDNPDRAQLLPLSHPIAIHFSLERISPGDSIEDAVCLDDPSFSEELLQSIHERAYPVLSEVLADPECTQEMIDAAIEQERAPIGEENPEVSAHPDAASVQTMMELPKSLAEALTEMTEDTEEGDEAPDEDEDLDELYEKLQAEPNPYFQMRTACKLISVASAQNRVTHLGQTFASPSGELPAIVTSFATCPVSRAADLSALLERTIQKFLDDNELAHE